MLFHTFSFIFGYLPLVCGIYWFLQRRDQRDLAMKWLTVASLVFYAWWSPPMLLLLLASIGANYFIAGHIAAASRPERRRVLLGLGVGLDLALLGYYKYTGFLLQVWQQLTGLAVEPPDLVLPLAISFFTFNQIAYLVDAYHGRVRPTNLWNYCLFVTFFPHLIAGPIVHHSEMMPQFESGARRITPTVVAVGVSIFALGLAKKVIVADTLGRTFAQSFEQIQAGATMQLLEAWIVLGTAAMHIYFDYSAYSDMALGLGLLFGIYLPLNFFSPYKATSIGDFWRRWNLTLMRFLRNYIYIPMGGSRYGLGRQMAAVMTTMVVCGLWHGAGWNYVVWGLMVGALLCASLAWSRRFPEPMRSPLRTIAGRATVFAAYVIPLAIFLFPQLGTGLGVVKALFGLNGFAIPPIPGVQLSLIPTQRFETLPGPDVLQALLMLVIALAIVYGSPNVFQLFGGHLARVPNRRDFAAAEEADGISLLSWRPNRRWAIAGGATLGLSLGFLDRVREFFYFQF